MTNRTLAFFGALVLLPWLNLVAQDAGSGGPAAASDQSHQEEAPASLFDQKVGDVGVVLDAEGTWTTRLSGGWGAGFSSEAMLPGLTYPGFEHGTDFTQIPDFSLTLMVMERYYFELAYRGTVDDRSFELGYKGKEGEVLQWAKLGNAPFSVPSRAGQSLATGRLGAPAVGAALTLGPVDLEFLARYEDGTQESKTYLGFREAESATVGLDAWVRNRFFRLPGPYPVSGVRVLVADPEGTLVGGGGTKYRTATGAEAVVDLASGEVRLPATASKTYLVTWAQAPAASSPPTSILFPGVTAGTETIAGAGTFFVLVQPGVPTPFEIRNRYPVTVGVTGDIVLVRRSDGKAVSGHAVTHASSQDWFEVAGSEEGPFWGDSAPLFRGLYPSAAPPPASNTLPWLFRLPTTTTATTYELGKDVMASSLVIVRNGVPTTAYRFNSDTGSVAMDVPIYDTDTVVISFQRKTTSLKASDLVVWHGGRWTIDDHEALEWNLQGRWNMESGRYTTEDLQAPGKVSASLAWTGSEGDWKLSAAATGGALLADSTGHRRVAGWTSGYTAATYDGNSLRPSAPPGTLGSPSQTLTAGNRGASYFRDYWTNDALTGTPQVSAWGKAGVTVSPYGADGWMGPYLVRGDGVRTDRLGVTEAELAPGQWAGMEVFFDSGRPLDLKTTAAVSATVRLVGGQVGDRVFLQVGTVAEDFDGTGTVRSVQYLGKPALGFSDQGTRRYFPIPEGSTWGNDGSGDGAAGQDGSLVTIELTDAGSVANSLTPSADTGWQTIRYVLTDTQRQLLQRATGWRLVVVSSSSAPTTSVRRLMVGPVNLEGSAWSVVSDGSTTGTVSAAEVDDSSRSDGHNLRVDWEGRSSWGVLGRFSEVRTASYQTISFRYKVAASVSSNPVPLSVELTNASSQGLRVSWSAPYSPSWVSAKITIATGALTLDGVPTSSTVSINHVASWDRMTLSVASAPTSGVVYLAEVEATDPVWEPVGASTATAAWKQPAPWPSAELPLVTGANLSLASVHSGVTQDALTWVGQSSASGNLGPLQTSIEASVASTSSGSVAHGAYQATLPVAWPGGPSLEVTDRFSDRGLRSERVRLGLPWVGTWEAFARVSGVPTTLDQQYRTSWSSPTWLPPGWNLGWSAQWDQSRPTDLTLDTFGPQWRDSWSWLIPPGDTAPYHLVQSQVSFQAGTTPWSVAGNLSVQAAQTVSAATTKWAPGGSWSLKAPLHFDTGGEWSLTPSVTKTVSWVLSEPGPKDPGASALDGWNLLEAQAGGLFSLPFAEQGQDASWTGSAETATVESTTGLDWSRSTGSDWVDLVVPGSGGIKAAATRGRESSSDYRTGTLSAYLQTRAVNLFGSLGNVPLVNWYQSDVWIWSAAGSRTIGTRPTDDGADASLMVRSDLVLSPREKLSLPVTYQGKWSTSPVQTLGAKVNWSLEQAANLPFELPRWLSPKSFHRQWIHEVATALTLGWQPTNLPVVRDLQVSWKGRFLLSDKSELSFTTKWGQQWQETVMVVGLEADVDLVLSF